MNRPAERPVRIRELRTGEYHPVDAVFAGLSPESRYLRFHAGLPRLSDPMREALVAVDGRRHVALVAESQPGAEPVGIARFVGTAPDRAELAIAVVDAWHHRGVGRRLLVELRHRAERSGFRELTALVLPHNEAVLRLLRQVFPGTRTAVDDDVLELTLPLATGVSAVDRSAA
jgi:ribosomal protein S18 acetylase RimI-like enzyme